MTLAFLRLAGDLMASSSMLVALVAALAVLAAPAQAITDAGPGCHLPLCSMTQHVLGQTLA